MSTTWITNARIVNEGKVLNGSLVVRDERIAAILPPGKQPEYPADRIIDAGRQYLLPGIIDDHVHFREPGFTHKGDIFHESRAAVAGGVTSFMDMPNSMPQTTTLELLEEKFSLASKVSLANFSFYMGATNDNLDELLGTDPSRVCGIKIFMGSSTGNMLVDNPDTLKEIFSRSPALIAVHCEDEPLIRQNTRKARERFSEDVPVYFHPRIRDAETCYRSSRLAVDLARQYGTRLHLLHLSTASEISLLRNDIPVREKPVTAEVCIHHLLFGEPDYFTSGNLIKLNPAIKSPADRDALFRALADGYLDVVATDHAPHTMDEKQHTYFECPAGGPMVQHSLAVMLEFVKQDRLGVELVVEKMCHAPADLFRIHERGYIREGYYADLVLVDMDSRWTVSEDNIYYKCGWSSLLGRTFTTRVTGTFVNGNLVYENGQFTGDHKGKRLTFTNS